jgi:hypothetical protein
MFRVRIAVHEYYGFVTAFFKTARTPAIQPDSAMDSRLCLRTCIGLELSRSPHAFCGGAAHHG